MGTLAPPWDIAADLASLRVPMLIAHGRYDYVVPHFLWHDVAASLQRASVRLFHESGHQPFFEEPERFALALTDWMASEP